jgi:hypothetical protein
LAGSLESGRTRSTYQIPHGSACQIPHNVAQAGKPIKAAELAAGREEGAVARVRVSLEAFHNGALPPVCAKTGQPADCLLPVRAAYAPRWTWLLLLFGGFWAFLIGRGFTTEETMGLVPFSQATLARWRVRRRDRLAAAVLGGVLLLALLYRVAWPLAFFGGCLLIAVLFGFAWVSLLGGAELGAHLDPEAQTVLLWGVHERFKQAVEDGQRPDPNVRYWQTQ